LANHIKYTHLSADTGNRKREFFVIAALLLACLFSPLSTSHAAEIKEVSVRQLNNEIYVSASIALDPKTVSDLNAGLSKELVFYLDLFRVWNVWPDEFVTGKKITRTLNSNPIKREYTAVSTDSNIILEKRFKDPEAMLNWALNIPDRKLTNVRELEAGVYFVKVTVESRVRTLPPVIGYLLFFVPENEFSLSMNSQTFPLNPKGKP